MADLVANLQPAYRAAVTSALRSAMLDNSGPLNVGPDEWLSVSAKRDTPVNPFDPRDSVRTITLTVRGTDLAAFHQKRITREQAEKLVLVHED